MEALGPWHILLILIGFVLLFGYRKLPDASRSIGRSLRIFRSELRGLADDDRPTAAASSAEAARGAAQPSAERPSAQQPSADELEREAAAAEARAARLRARAEAVARPRPVTGTVMPAETGGPV